jgi:hypothetical protein
MRITKAHDYDLTGELVERRDAGLNVRGAANSELIQIN